MFGKCVCARYGGGQDEVKVFDMVLLRYLHIIDMDRWARFSSRSECHMDRLSFTSFNLPISAKIE
jgi:hypothetical protein